MKIKDIFEQVESRPKNSGGANQFLSFNGTGNVWSTGGASGTLIGWDAGNAGWNTQTRKVDYVQSFKLFGITLWKRMTELDPEAFFEKVKKSKQEIKLIDGIVDKYLASIETAEKFGQTAFVEQLKDNIEVVKKEALAVAAGVREYITQAQFDALCEKSTKNIEADYVKNFVRHIPVDLLEKKVKLEGVFDDFIVVHYDPKKENSQLTKKEIEKKKDPILFGIISGSRNLYYIGDWVDEHCNLTLKEAVSIINDKTKKLYEEESIKEVSKEGDKKDNKEAGNEPIAKVRKEQTSGNKTK